MTSNNLHRSHATHLVRKSCGWLSKPPILFTAIRRKATDRFCIRRSRQLFGSITVNKPSLIEEESLSRFICGYQQPTSIFRLFHLHHHVLHYKYRHRRRLFRSEYSKDRVRGSDQTSGRAKEKKVAYLDQGRAESTIRQRQANSIQHSVQPGILCPQVGGGNPKTNIITSKICTLGTSIN